ncbi:flagellar brake protein [Teredinibacter purpureus]|uniref:flagellar brake protein n=1 Tax=Teredinibacter purpureus TaxID=2731756 RepID=UPI0005F8775B|nr:flagellar brake protein [Teredinibacter purpureus]
MSDKQLLSFEQLNLKMGQVIQIHPNPGKSSDRFDCVLVGCLPGEAVIVTVPDSGHFPPLKEGHKVVIRVMSSNGVALFPTVVLHIADIPIYLVYLDFPRAIQFKLVRNASRVDVALPILISNPAQKSIRSEPGRITDISIGGAMVSVSENIGTMGDMIEIKGKFDVAGIKRTLGIQAVIRSKVDQTADTYQFGVQFDESDEDKLLVLFGYIFNAMAMGDPKNIE